MFNVFNTVRVPLMCFALDPGEEQPAALGGLTNLIMESGPGFTDKGEVAIDNVSFSN